MPFVGSARNEVRVDIGLETEVQLIPFDGVVIEPDRLLHVSLGQVNPRLWMNAAPGDRLQGWDLIVVGLARIPQHTKTLGILANRTTQNVLPQQRSGALFCDRSVNDVSSWLMHF